MAELTRSLYDLENLPYLVAALAVAMAVVLLFGSRARRGARTLGVRWRALAPRRYGIAGITAAAALLAGHYYLGTPQPWVMDESSYLLSADTFVHGRLTNPPHSLAEFFETPYVLQHPTYSSMYQPGPGLVLALGTWLGNPWYGVALTVFALALALVWALEAWMPPVWALTGALLGISYFGFSYWAHSYWGGALAALGGAVLLGALGRFRRHPIGKWTAVAALGGVLLLAVRPAEGAALSAAAALYLLGLAFRGGHGRALLPAVAVAAVGLAGQAYFNWRVTGDPLLPPYVLGMRNQVSRRMFVWQQHRPDPPAPHPFLADVARMHYRAELTGWARFQAKYEPMLNLFGGALWLAPLLLLPWLARDRRLRPLVALTAVVVALNLVTEWVHPHYAAPATAGLLAILVLALRHLWTRPWGRPLAALLLVSSLLAAPVARLAQERADAKLNPFPDKRRELDLTLRVRPAPQLVIVRYGPRHSPHVDWVMNTAAIDEQKIVWARDYGDERNRKLLEYFARRDAWLWEPDTERLSLLRTAIR